MKILEIPEEWFKPLLRAEALEVWKLYQSELLREIYFRTDQSSTVLILECGRVEEAQQILSTLPLVIEKLITFEVIPLAPYPGFTRLFE
jgi:hypothetical protein